MIFRVRSAKAVKITDMDLIKRLGVIVGIFERNKLAGGAHFFPATIQDPGCS